MKKTVSSTTFSPRYPFSQENPTRRSQLRGGKSRAPRAPWYTGFPNNNSAAAWAQTLKRK